MSFDIDPRQPGNECWSSLPGLYTCKGEWIGNASAANAIPFQRAGAS